jgi:hypothetical protein
MKSLTTMLADRAATDAPADGLKAWRDAAQAQIGEPVIDACIFSRPTSYGANALASHSGPLVGMLLRKSREIRAGGLPPHFVLAVTAEDVVALRRTMKARGGPLGEPGEEVARWRREDLEVSWRGAGYLLTVTLVARSSGEQVECCVGNSPLSVSFLELLADPARLGPAVAA